MSSKELALQVISDLQSVIDEISLNAVPDLDKVLETLEDIVVNLKEEF